jgi:hypothetical protein
MIIKALAFFGGMIGLALLFAWVILRSSREREEDKNDTLHRYKWYEDEDHPD